MALKYTGTLAHEILKKHQGRGTIKKIREKYRFLPRAVDENTCLFLKNGL
jgi:hypothetical protein